MDRVGFEPTTCPNLDFFAKGLDDWLYPTRLDDRPNRYPTSAGLEKLDTSTLDARSNGSSRGPLKKSAPDRGYERALVRRLPESRGMEERVPKRSEAARPPFEEDAVGIQQDSVPPDRGDALQEGGRARTPNSSSG